MCCCTDCTVSYNVSVQIPDSGDVEKADCLSENYLVELSVFSSSPQDPITEELKTFAEQLKPYPLVYMMYTHVHAHTSVGGN